MQHKNFRGNKQGKGGTEVVLYPSFAQMDGKQPNSEWQAPRIYESSRKPCYFAQSYGTIML